MIFKIDEVIIKFQDASSVRKVGKGAVKERGMRHGRALAFFPSEKGRTRVIEFFYFTWVPRTGDNTAATHCSITVACTS
jgi:hypothetical protein